MSSTHIKETSPISIEQVFASFKEHFDLPSNNNIILSGKYGIGKTYFLQKFFEQNSETTNAIFVSPVQYSVISNDNIFDLIKADIIRELFVNGHFIVKKQVEFDKFDYVSHYIANNPLKLIEYLLPLWSKVSIEGAIANEAMKSLKTFKKDVEAFKKRIDKAGESESLALMEFAEKANTNNNTFLEENAITTLIKKLLSGISKNGKKNVLVIDDFDRLDPEHIFRILNILCVHKDENYNENKFGFDKIILVCDIENIEKIFHHKYGSTVDFDGYIDKFYSLDIFKFTNRDAIVLYIERDIGKELSESGKLFFCELLIILIRQGHLTVRQLMKHHHLNSINIPNKIINTENFNEVISKWDYRGSRPSFLKHISLNIYAEDVEVFKIIRFLSILIGDLDKVDSIINSLRKTAGRNIMVDQTSGHTILTVIIKAYHFLMKGRDDRFFSFRHGSLKYPIGEYRTVPYEIIFKYTHELQYDGSEGFFKDAKVVPLPNNIPNPRLPVYIDWKDVFNDLSDIIKRFRQHFV